MRTSRKILFAALAAAVWVSCNKELDNTFSRQEDRIASLAASLMKDNADATVSYSGGSTTVTVVHGEGTPLEEGGAVSFYYAAHSISGNTLDASNLFATNYDVYAKSIQWALSDTTVFSVTTLNLKDADLVEGLRNGLVGVRGGDECYVLFSGRHGFGKKKVASVPANAALAYHLWVVGVSNE